MQGFEVVFSFAASFLGFVQTAGCENEEWGEEEGETEGGDGAKVVGIGRGANVAIGGKGAEVTLLKGVDFASGAMSGNVGGSQGFLFHNNDVFDF